MIYPDSSDIISHLQIDFHRSFSLSFHSPFPFCWLFPLWHHFFLARARLIINQHKTVPQNDFNFVCNWYVWPGSIVIGGRFKMVESIGERTFFLLSGMKHRYSWSNVNLFRRQLINKLNGLPQSCAWCQFLLAFPLIWLNFCILLLWHYVLPRWIYTISSGFSIK